MVRKGIFLSAIVTAALVGQPREAAAGIDACGGIHIEAGASCRLVPPGAQCELQCTPLSVEAACAAKLYVGCGGECSASASAQCTATCETGCQGECSANPGSFDCRASCQASCEGRCDASCSAGDSQCIASCQTTCSGSCDAQCEAVPPSASCEARCEASCSGSCSAEANLECQIECQAAGYVECVVDVQGGCQAECQSQRGALFCDGQFVDHGGNLDACVEALKSLLNIEVEGYVRVDCDGASCEAEAGGSLSCAAAGAPGGLAGVALVLALGLLRRRRT